MSAIETYQTTPIQIPGAPPKKEEKLTPLQQKEKEDLENWKNSSPEGRDRAPGNYRVPGYYDKANPTWLNRDLSPSNPLPWQQYLPKEVSELGYQQMDRNAGSINSDLTKGINNHGIFGTPEDSPQSQAIARKYQNIAQNKIDQIKTSAGEKSVLGESKQLQSASDIFGTQQKVLMQNFKEQYSFQEQRKQAFSQYQNAQSQATAGFFASVIQAIGIAAMAASDERLKTNVRPANVQEFLDSIGAHKYEYKNKYWGAHTYISPMAQELEKTDLGRGMVINTPQGKMVDYQRGLGLVFAALSQINERLNKMEKK